MNSSNRPLTFADVFHLVFVCVASIVVLGWIVKLKGGNPLDLLQALLKGLFVKASLGRTLDMAAAILIAACGCAIGANARLWNIGAEGQCLVGFACTCWAAKAIGDSWLVVPLALTAALISGGLSGLVACAPSQKGDSHDEVAAGLIFNVMVGVLLLGYHPEAPPLLFPLIEGWQAPRAGLVAALAVFLIYRYVNDNLAIGIKMRALPDKNKLQAYAPFVAGAFCGFAGGILALAGHGSLGTTWGPEGIGFLAFAIAYLAIGNLWIFIPLLALFVAAIASGWAPDERVGMTISALAITIVGVATFLELRTKEVA